MSLKFTHGGSITQEASESPDGIKRKCTIYLAEGTTDLFAKVESWTAGDAEEPRVWRGRFSEPGCDLLIGCLVQAREGQLLPLLPAETPPEKFD